MQNCQWVLDQLKANTVLKSTHTTRHVIHYPDPVYRGFQGGCSDGERYYYQVLMHYELDDRTKDYACIAKVDLQLGKTVAYSKALMLDHANDMTYHPGKHLLIVCNNAPHPRRLTFVDPDTLEIVGTQEIPFSIYSIEYNAKRDGYVVGLSGTREFRFLDADFNPTEDVTHRATPLTDRYTKQGVCADDELVYFIMWDGKHKDLPDFQNVITVYDWQGTYRGMIHFDIGPYEPEDLSIVNGELLAVCVDAQHTPTIYCFEPAEAL
ncbi:MAG: hypothetical protein IJY50_07355 [Clostridia bacterium]|nr:hypothetical protein [Clostridia bacterium]